MKRRELLQHLASVPVLALPTLAGSATLRELSAAPASLAIAGQSALPVWAYNAQVPGPVLRYRRGEVLDLAFHNRLPEPSTIHWHGLRLPNAMDGVPHITQAPVASGERFRYRFALPDAGTFWYHPHLGTPEQVERGLAGALVVEDDAPPPVDADVVWLIDDWRLGPDGRIAEDFYNFRDVSHAGRLGQHLTVNGQLAPVLPLQTGQRLRLRLINAANARIFALELQGLPAWLIARDGVPADTAVPWEGPLLLGPGMRADIIVDAVLAGSHALTDRFGRGQRTLGTLAVSGSQTLERLAAPRPAQREPLPEPVLERAVQQELVMGGGMMNRFGWPEDPPEERAARRQRQLSGAREPDPVWTINGQAHMTHHAGHPPEFSIRLGQTVRMVFDNRTAWWHPMHLHGHHFRILTRNGEPLPERPWRDTVLMAPQDRIEIAFVADNPGRWLIHCHVLEHHAGGMGTMFEVVG